MCCSERERHIVSKAIYIRGHIYMHIFVYISIAREPEGVKERAKERKREKERRKYKRPERRKESVRAHEGEKKRWRNIGRKKARERESQENIG